MRFRSVFAIHRGRRHQDQRQADAGRGHRRPGRDSVGVSGMEIRDQGPESATPGRLDSGSALLRGHGAMGLRRGTPEIKRMNAITNPHSPLEDRSTAWPRIYLNSRRRFRARLASPWCVNTCARFGSAISAADKLAGNRPSRTLAHQCRYLGEQILLGKGAADFRHPGRGFLDHAQRLERGMESAKVRQ